MDTTTPPATREAPANAIPSPLLPPVLSGPAALIWLWVLPIAVLQGLNAQAYWIIEGNMDPAQRQAALTLGLAGLANLVLGLAFFAAMKRAAAKSPIAPVASAWWGLPAIVVQIAYLWLACNRGEAALPASVTVWIYPPERLLFNHFAFAMLPLFLGILRVACIQPVQGLGKAIATSVALAFGAPIALYLALNLIGRFQPHTGGEFVVIVTAVIAMGLLMFIAIVRALMLILRFGAGWADLGERVAILGFALILPLSGLLLNRSISFPVDFQAWEVYVLTLGNAAILGFASWHRARWPRLSFCLLCFTLPFSLYFFIVFLPYTPLSVLAVIALGTGFLVLTPTLLFTLHLHLLNRTRPPAGPGRARLVAAGGLSFLLLPAVFTLRGLADKAALHAALDYLYEPSIERGPLAYPASRLNLRRALANHRAYKNGIYYPLLSDWYSWLVFDNLVLPDDRLARLEQVFFGAAGSNQNLDPLRNSVGSVFGGRSSVRQRGQLRRAVPPPQTVAVSHLAVSVLPLVGSESTVTLTLTLRDTGPAAAEYRQSLPLPPGVFVTGFRLWVNGASVPGRIFERKTALWVYSMIRDSERRDPGVLVYERPDALELRVYPVTASAPTTVEIDLLVPGRPPPADAPAATNDPAAVLAWLGDTFAPQLAEDSRGVLFASGRTRGQLPGAEREPYLQVIIDRSADRGFTGDWPAALQELQQRFPAARRARITVANHSLAEVVPELTALRELASRSSAELTEALPLSGGLDLDRVIARALLQHRNRDLDHWPSADSLPPRPVLVILSRQAAPRTLELPVTDAWCDLVPGLEIYEIGADGSWVIHHKPGNPDLPMVRRGSSVRPLVPGRATRFAAGPAAQPLEYWAPATRDWRQIPDVATPPAPSHWAHAVALQLQQHDQARSPGDCGIDLAALVRSSRESGVLAASTSYIAVENEAQWRTLELSERQKLGQNSALEFRETPAPPAAIVALGFGVWLLVRRWRRARVAGVGATTPAWA